MIAAAAALVALGRPAAAGQAEVSFDAPDRFSDAGDTPWQRDDNLQVLSRHLQKLAGQRLPAGQTLTVEVTDVDLAGRQVPTSRWRIRVANGGADWPRITLRYALRADGQTLRSGEETVADLDYLRHGVTLLPNDPLRHEKRMLDAWFDSRFAPTRAASR